LPHGALGLSWAALPAVHGQNPDGLDDRGTGIIADETDRGLRPAASTFPDLD